MGVALLRLRPLTLADESQALSAHAELAADAFSFLLDYDPASPWAEHVAKHEAWRRGRDVPDDRVAATFLVATVGERIVGRVSVRHQLNAFLREEGGHIGYGVRPADRRRGLATAILRGALPVARAAGVARALVTCDEGNKASARTIERCGGVFERLSSGEPPQRRYWVPTG